MSKSKVTVSSVAASTSDAESEPAVSSVPSVTEEQIEALVDAIDAFATAVGAGFETQSAAELKRLLRGRKDAATFVASTADLSQRYGISSPSNPIDVMLANQALVNTLRPVGERIDAAQKLLNDVVSVAQSNAWRSALVNYGLLKAEARTNPVLTKALAPSRESLRPTYVTPEGTRTHKRSRKAPTTGATPKAKAAAAAPASSAPAAGEATTVAEPAAAAAPVAATEVTAAPVAAGH